jgi:hypothetical protein
MLRQILLASAIIAAVWATVLLYFALQDRLRDMWDAMVVMNGHNAGLSVVSNLSMLFSRWWVGFYLEHTLLVAPAIGLALGALLARGSRDRRAWMLLLGSLAAVAAVVTLPVRPFHYYLHLWLPFLAVGCGWTWHVLTAFRSRCRFVPELALGSIVLAALWVQVPWFRQPASAWSEFRRGSILNETHQLGLDINRLLRPDETFYMWGGETGLYFASQRLPPTGFINTDSVESGPIAGRLSQRLQAQLLAHPPELLVLLIPNLRIPSDPECRKVWSWFTQHYGIMPTTGLKGSYLLCCRIGGSLERRTGTARPLNEQLRVQMPDGSSQQAR